MLFGFISKILLHFVNLSLYVDLQDNLINVKSGMYLGQGNDVINCGTACESVK